MGRFDEFLGGERDPAYDAPEPPPAVAGPALPAPSVPAQTAPVQATPATVPVSQGRFDEFVSKPPEAPIGPNEVDWAHYNQPFGTIQAGDPNLTEYTKGKVQDAILGAGTAMGGKPNPYLAGKVANAVVDLGGYTPLGSALSGGDALYSAAHGHPIRAGFEAIGAIPGVMQVRRGIQAVKGILPTLRMADTPLRTVDQATGKVTDELKNSSQAAYGRVAQAPIEYHPNAIEDYSWITKHHLQNTPDPNGNVFTPEAAPGVFSTLDRFTNQIRARGPQFVTPQDFDTLRRQLRSFDSGPDSAAGARAAQILDNYMYKPPPGAVVRMAPGALDTLRADMDAARGDWRAYKTSNTVESEIDRRALKTAKANSALNLDNNTRAGLESLVDPKYVSERLPGASWNEQQAIRGVIKGDDTTNQMRYWSNRLGGGGGAGGTVIGAGGAYGLNHLLGAWGVDPVSAAVIGGAAGFATPKVGEALRTIANNRTVAHAEEVVDQIRRNSPLYQARKAAAGPEPVDPFALQRDAIAYAMLPRASKIGTTESNRSMVPYENRAPGDDSSLLRRVLINTTSLP